MKSRHKNDGTLFMLSPRKLEFSIFWRGHYTYMTALKYTNSMTGTLCTYGFNMPSLIDKEARKSWDSFSSYAY